MCEQLVLQEQQLLFTRKIAVALKRPLFSQPFSPKSRGSCHLHRQGQNMAHALVPAAPRWKLCTGAGAAACGPRGVQPAHTAQLSAVLWPALLHPEPRRASRAVCPSVAPLIAAPQPRGASGQPGPGTVPALAFHCRSDLQGKRCSAGCAGHWVSRDGWDPAQGCAFPAHPRMTCPIYPHRAGPLQWL